MYVQAFPQKGEKRQISASGGIYPVWSRNGRELFFRNLENQIMVASYTVHGDSFLPDKPRVWSEKKLAWFSTTRSYDLAPDGKCIVELMPAESQEAQKRQDHLIFLLNFFDELRRRVPSGRNVVH